MTAGVAERPGLLRWRYTHTPQGTTERRHGRPPRHLDRSCPLIYFIHSQLVPESEFFPAWRAAVGRLLELGGPKSLAEAAGAESAAASSAAAEDAEFSLEGFEASEELLQGLFLRVRRAGEALLEPFAAEDLDLEPAARFRQLFAKQTEWSAAELEPFTARLVGPGRVMADLLLRFTRVVNKSDDTVVHTKR